MKLFLLIAWGVTAFVVFLVTVIVSIGDSDRDGRVRMPGKVVVELAAGEYGIWYEEPHSTGENDVFEPPDGIEVKVVGVENEPDPIVDLGGLGSQVGTDNRTAETIGTLTVARAGRYRLVAGDPPSGRADITLGAKGSESFVLAGKRVGYISVGFALALLLVWLRRFGGL